MIIYQITFANRSDADQAMDALEEASMEGIIECPFETQLITETDDE